MKKDKKHYCMVCGQPISFRAKFLRELKGAINVYATLIAIFLTFILYSMIKNPSALVNYWSMCFSFIANNAAGYGYNVNLKHTAMNILIDDYDKMNVSGLDKILSISDWINENIMYVNDNVAERLPSPETILSDGYGDCDDKSMLFCALIRQVGVQCRVECTQIHCYSVAAYFDYEDNVYYVYHVDVTNDEIYELQKEVECK